MSTTTLLPSSSGGDRAGGVKRGRRSAAVTPPPGSSASSSSPFVPPAMSIDDRIARMKRNLPLMYDSFIHYGMQWGSLSICWGALANDAPIILNGSNDACPSQFNDEQTVYFAGRTDGSLAASTALDGDAPPVWEGQPSELFVSRVAIPKPRTTRRSQLKTFQDNMKSSRVALEKRIVHPGEVNRLRAFSSSPHILATKSDSSTIFIWNVKAQEHRVLHPLLSEQSSFPTPSSTSSSLLSQIISSSVVGQSQTMGGSAISNPNAASSSASLPANAATNATSTSTTTSTTGPGRKPSKALQNAQAMASRAIKTRCSVPDMKLVGQSSTSDFALDCSIIGTGIASGTKDGFVTYWNIEDFAQSAGVSRGGGNLNPRLSVKMHATEVEDCAFNAKGDAICTVGRDRALSIWDTRSKTATSHVAAAHRDDVNCCSWSPMDANRIVTGGSDCNVKVWDARRLTGGPLFSTTRRSSVINVRFSPFDSETFAVADEGSWFAIFDMSSAPSGSSTTKGARDGIVFQHFGHRGPVVDFSWNQLNPFVLATVSDDSQDETRGGGGTMQVWRVNEMALGERLLSRAHAPPSPYSGMYGNPADWRAEIEEKLSVVAGSFALAGTNSSQGMSQASTSRDDD